MSNSHITKPSVPSLQALRILDAAVREQSYTKAADALGLTHGAVSRQIAALESWTGSKLFSRHAKQMRPTEAALVLATQTREALRILAGAFGHPLLPTAAAGLRLSTTHAIARLWLLPRLARLNAHQPGLIRGVEASSSLDAGWQKNVDVALRYGLGDWSGVHAKRLGGEQLFPVASPSLLTTVKDWTELPLLATPYQSWRPWLSGAHINFPARSHNALELPDSGTVLDAAAAGLGVALARSRLVSTYMKNGLLVAVSDFIMTDIYSYHLVWPADRKTPDAIHVLALLLELEFTADETAE